MSLILQENGTLAILLENGTDRLLQEDDAGTVGLIAAKLHPIATFKPATTVRTFHA
jgi:hypothetical protein